MIDLNMAATALVSLLSLTLLWIFFHWLWRDYRVDVVRESLFGLRDELFECGRSGLLPFEHPAYTELRSSINSIIQFAHQLTLFRFVLLGFSMHGYDASALSKRWQVALETLESTRARERLVAIRLRMMLAVFEHTLSVSTFVWLWAAIRCLKGVRNVFRFLRSAEVRFVEANRQSFELIELQAREEQLQQDSTSRDRRVFVG